VPGIRPLSAEEIALIASELRDGLLDAYFKSFYELGGGSFLMTFSRERKERAVFVSLGRSVHLTEFREEKKEPTRFTAGVRKALDACRLTGIERHGTDRILVMEFGGRRNVSVVLEMFGKGNMVLVDDKGLVELAYRSVSFSDRSVRKGMLYSFPAQRGRAGAGAGGAPEHPEPVLYVKDGKPLGFGIGPVQEYEREDGTSKRRFGSLSGLLDSLYLEERSSGRDEGKARQAEELGKSLEKLRAQMKENEADARECREAANAIFGRMHELNQLLAQARKLKPKEAGELGSESGIRVKKVDAKKKSITVEL
jgi:predicted ribosome quality control (RQC) complex YloA/Tae2 family protein